LAEQILIVGGGFAGFWAALAAKRVAKDRASVTLVSRDPVLQIRPRLYEANPNSLGVDLVPLLRSAAIGFVQGDAFGLNLGERMLELASGDRLAYARLVVATGSTMRRPPVPGADEAYSVDTQSEAIKFDRRLAEVARDVPNPHMVVVGAGFTGIELALELRDRLGAHGAPAAAESARISLVDRADTVGSELGPGPRFVIEAALDQAHVEVHLSATITELAADRVTFADGTILDADTVVLTTGMAAGAFVANVPGQRDELGRIVVDRSLRASMAPNVFLAGDAAAADTGDGHRALQSCQHALQLGRFAGENAARDLLGLPMLAYAQPSYITCLDLGRSGAVLTEGWERTVRYAGPEAKARKRFINRLVIYPPANFSGEALLGLSSTDPADQRRLD
jgi:NADH dehydrogenase